MAKNRVIDLTSLDREAVEPGYQREPFVVNIGSEDAPEEAMEVTFSDPKELPWDVVVTMDETPRRFFATAVADREQRAHILSLDSDKALKLWQLQYIMNEYRKHYGIDRAGNDVASRR